MKQTGSPHVAGVMGEEGEARQPRGLRGGGKDFAGAAGAVQQRDVLEKGAGVDMRYLNEF